MCFILEIILLSWIDPFFWLKSMSTLGVRKNKKQCTLFFLIYCFLIIGKSIWEWIDEGSIVKECAIFFILLYTIFATWYLFEGTFHDKMIYILMFYCILIITELSVIGTYTLLFPEDMDGVLHDGISNFICGGLVKILQGLFCYYIFKRNKTKKFFYQNIERLSLILVGFTILCILYFGKVVNKESFNKTTLLEIVFLCWYIVSLMIILKGKNKQIGELKQKAKSSAGTPQQVSDIDQFRHDFSTHVFLMKNCWYYKNYEKLDHYFNTVFAETEKVEQVFEHPNAPVRIVASNLIQMAAKAGIPFSVQMDVNDFGMSDEDICMVFHNIGLNGLDLASEVPVKKAYVQLEALYNDTGYVIQCKSTCIEEESRQQDSREQRENIAFGTELVDTIIKKYDGIMEKKIGKFEGKNIYEREVVVQIPYK